MTELVLLLIAVVAEMTRGKTESTKHTHTAFGEI